MKKQLFFTLALFCCSLVSFGQIFNYLGINYSVTSLTTVAVRSNPTSFNGSANIPATVVYNNANYQVTSIGQDAFSVCTGLNSVTIPNSVTSIGQSAFRSCTGLTSVSIPNSVTTIGQAAFNSCTGLTSLIIPNSVISIGQQAFINCMGLTSITIPSSVTSIGNFTFYACTGLTSVTVNWETQLPNFNTNVFGGITLGNVTLNIPSGTTALYTASDLWQNFNPIIEAPILGQTFTANGINYIVTKATVPYEAAVHTHSSFFSGPANIPTSVANAGNTFSVTSINSNAFVNCSGLTSVTIPNSVTSISASAFYDCTGLTSVTIPNSVISIGNFAFYNCTNLTSVNIPISVNSIANAAFYNCTGLTSVTVNWANPIGINANVFQNVAIGSVNLFVPADTVGAYQAFAPWNNFNIIEQLSALESQNNVSCFGDNNGITIVNAFGGNSPYTYSWSPSGGNGAIAFNLTAGNYTCTINDFIGNSITKNFVITQPSPLTSGVASQTNVSCNGGNNGSATITVGGGTPSYTYAWLPSGGTAATATGLAAGTYNCTITDANLCTKTESIVITQPSVLTSGVASQTNVSCNSESNGSATITAGGGTPGYTYSWLPSGGTAATATGLTAGTYTCTITDANQCTKTQSVVITQPSALTSSVASQTNVSCNGENNGSATITAGGGTPGYTYSWLPSGGTAATATRLTAGTYTCTITDANLCTKTQFFVITQPAAITLSVASQTNVSCFGGSNGAASINNPTSRAGGGGYSYNWTPGNPTGDGTTSVTGLTAGTWTCTVTDGNFCTKDQIFIITEPTALTSGIVAQTNVFCNGENNGSATVDTDGGAGSYTYSWSPSGGTAATATGLTAGTYTCTITDANQCTKTQSVIITQPTVLPNNVTTISNCDSYTWTNNGQTYATSGNYIGTTTNCVTEELNLTINTTPVISGNAIQNFNVTDTIASIIVNPTNVVWYANLAAANAGTSPLLATQVLANNTTYYAVTTGTCPSVPFAVLVGTTLSNNSFNNQLNIKLYPNPSTGIFNLKLPTDLQIEVYNNLGQLLSSEKMFSGSNVINIADKPAGIYFLKANDGNNVSTFKIIKN